ncbi:MAG: hypothetical protein JNM78_13375 [Cyclobacteriaceae bacterium]|nr:hypothetical protein [Cyclobacteriaceae bacterium]
MRRIGVLFLFLPLLAHAQVSMDDFLLAAWNEPALQSFSNQDDYLNTNPYRLAPIRRLEFRTESNQLDRTRQDYALRLNPASPWEMKRNNQYFRTYQELLQLDRDRVLKESLQTRYRTIVDWVYYEELKTLKEEESQTTDKLIQILEGQRYSAFFDAKAYVELKLDHVEKLIELEETRFEMDNQRRKVEGLYEKARLKNISWSPTDLLSMEKIEQVVDSVNQLMANSGEVAYREKKIELANSEWQLEKSNINVGYLQTKYENYRIEQNRRPWSVSLGVTIPVFNPNKGNMTKRKLEVLEAEGDLEQARNEQHVGRDLMQAKIKNLIKRYRDVSTMVEKLKLNELGATLQQIKDSNPMATVRLQNNLIRSREISAKLKHEINISYIEFLSYAEALQQRPLTNFLSPHLTTLLSR